MLNLQCSSGKNHGIGCQLNPGRDKVVGTMYEVQRQTTTLTTNNPIIGGRGDPSTVDGWPITNYNSSKIRLKLVASCSLP